MDANMNMPDPQTMSNTWMAQLNDPEQWKTWFNSEANAKPNPMTAMTGMAAMTAMLSHAGANLKPDAVERLRQEYVTELGKLWGEFMSGKTPELSDRRFTGQAWRENPLSAYSAASYLLNSKFLTALADAVDANAHQKQKIRCAITQSVDAMSPANFFATNPEAQKHLIETKGESLTRGMSNLLADMQKGQISQSDESAFRVGDNVAITPGDVVYENELFQLIQYKPTTGTVHQVPLLMVPPCINKFYILDLQPENSLVRYVVEQGNTVFLVSWRNADQSMSKLGWDDYVEKGVIEAIHVTQQISGQQKLNTFGFCVGGTLLGTALAVLEARGEQPAASVSLLTAMLDFFDTGALEVFVDEAQVSRRESAIGKGGLMSGRELASTFSSLRPNDLVWNYVQSNYLKGKEPPAFDLLYWNADSTSLPGPMFCWYLRNTYLENSLKIPGKLTVAGQPVDLSRIDAPVFLYGSREDHIVPWQTAYASAHLLNPGKPGANRFILGASGHIAGVINPASKNKRSYWKVDSQPGAGEEGGESAEHAANGGAAPATEEWLAAASEHKGSWWKEWTSFLAEHGGPDVVAPAQPGSESYRPIEAAPGRYVKARVE
jgi:polyhydroxyalkanoate synthase